VSWSELPYYSNTIKSAREGDNKVLRTIKIKEGGSYRGHERYHMFNYFCNNNCLFDFIRTHLQEIVAIAPRREALETPIKVVKEKYESYRYRWNGEGRTERVPYKQQELQLNQLTMTMDNIG
jgi:hypothetical protein